MGAPDQGPAPGGGATEARVVDLELRFMTLERFARELSDVVADQQRVIEGLTAEVRRLADRAAAEDGDSGARPQEEKPPHY
jgi:uncharacterized coiled-coil protein SlyX